MWQLRPRHGIMWDMMRSATVCHQLGRQVSLRCGRCGMQRKPPQVLWLLCSSLVQRIGPFRAEARCAPGTAPCRMLPEPWLPVKQGQPPVIPQLSHPFEAKDAAGMQFSGTIANLQPGSISSDWRSHTLRDKLIQSEVRPTAQRHYRTDSHDLAIDQTNRDAEVSVMSGVVQKKCEKVYSPPSHGPAPP
jgi:hypothetical protein